MKTGAFGLVAEIKTILVPLLAVTMIVALGLKLLDYLPSQIERLRASMAERSAASRVLRFDSLEAAERQLRLEIPVPIYFPDYLEWPAASVYAQREPATVTIVFRSADLREGLTMRQALAPGPEPLFPEPFVTLSRSEVQLDMRTTGVLVEGMDNDGAPRNQLYWSIRDRHIALMTPFSAPELLRMAQSTHFRHSK